MTHLCGVRESCKRASTLLHRCVSTPASRRTSGILNCEASLETREGTKILPLTQRDHLNCFFFFILLRFSVSDIQEQSRTRQTPALPSTVPFQPARTAFSRKPVCERRALANTAQTSPQRLEASMRNSEGTLSRFYLFIRC